MQVREGGAKKRERTIQATLGKSLRGRLHVALYEESRVSSLQSDGKALEEKLDFLSRVSSPPSSILTRNFLKECEGILVPASEGFDDQRLEKDSL